MTVDYDSGDPVPAGGVTFDPAAATGSAANSLALTSATGGTTFTSETYTATGPGAGTISYTNSANNNRQISFSNLSPVTDTVPSSAFTFSAPAAAPKVELVAGPTVGGAATTQIDPFGTGTFESIDFANKTTATVNNNNSGSSTTVFANPAAGLTDLYINANAGNENVFVEGSQAGTTTHVDTGSGSGSTTYLGTSALVLSSILGNVDVQFTGGSNRLILDDQGETSAETYTIANFEGHRNVVPGDRHLRGRHHVAVPE